MNASPQNIAHFCPEFQRKTLRFPLTSPHFNKNCFPFRRIITISQLSFLSVHVFLSQRKDLPNLSETFPFRKLVKTQQGKSLKVS